MGEGAGRREEGGKLTTACTEGRGGHYEKPSNTRYDVLCPYRYRCTRPLPVRRASGICKLSKCGSRLVVRVRDVFRRRSGRVFETCGCAQLAFLAPMLIGAVGLFGFTQRPGFAAFRSADIVLLCGCGMCFGVAATALVAYLRRPHSAAR